LEGWRARDELPRGLLAWRVPAIADAKIGKLPVDSPEGMMLWASYLKIGAEIPPEERGLVEQLATLVVFDVVIDNSDRWSGANAKASPDGKTLYFMDNTLAFSKFKHGHDANLAPMRRLQVFPRGLIQKLRTLTLAQLNAALDLGNDDTGLAPLLDEVEVNAVLSRRNHVIEYVDQLIAEFGEDKVLALP